MTIYAVRILNNAKWHTVRTYGTRSEAELFASLLLPAWDIKEVSVEEAIEAESK
jgi:hypothetical protein